MFLSSQDSHSFSSTKFKVFSRFFKAKNSNFQICFKLVFIVFFLWGSHFLLWVGPLFGAQCACNPPPPLNHDAKSWLPPPHYTMVESCAPSPHFWDHPYENKFSLICNATCTIPWKLVAHASSYNWQLHYAWHSEWQE